MFWTIDLLKKNLKVSSSERLRHPVKFVGMLRLNRKCEIQGPQNVIYAKNSKPDNNENPSGLRRYTIFGIQLSNVGAVRLLRDQAGLENSLLLLFICSNHIQLTENNTINT